MDKFVDLRDAGGKLSTALTNFSENEKTYVVAIATGGVPVAAEVANQLNLPLEILLLKRLRLAEDPTQPLCAFDVAGVFLLDPEIGPIPDAPETGSEHSLVQSLGDLARRKQSCRGSLPNSNLAGMNVLLVDNGIRTGSTMLAATRALKQLNVNRIVAAVPVANPESKRVVEEQVDELIALGWPDNFGHVGLWYKDFSRPSDEKIHAFLESNYTVFNSASLEQT
jgi:putative phosphoribosyl transferase